MKVEIEELFADTFLESIGHGNFDIGQEYDEYFDSLFLGISLKDNLLYIYYENCPGRDYVIYKWNRSKQDFDDFINIIENLNDRSGVITLAFNLLKGK